MNPLLLEFLGSIVRWVLGFVIPYLVERHIITADLSGRLTSAILEHLAVWLPMGAALVWSLWHKYRSRLRFLAALNLPAGASAEAVSGEMKSIPTADVIAHPY